jgi:hypothetical protein
MDYINPQTDLIYYNDSDNNIYSGGFSVQSLMLKNGISPIATINNSQQGGSKSNKNTKVSELFENLVVPNWLLSQSSQMIGAGNSTNINSTTTSNDNTDDVISDDIYNKLFNSVNINKNTHKSPITKKHKNNKKKIHNKTKRY